jgi:hypothetical protein
LASRLSRTARRNRSAMGRTGVVSPVSVCYPGSTMTKRAGVTAKISISLRQSDAASLRKRAKRLYGGNLSAVIAELAGDAALLEGMQELVDRLGGPSLTDDDRQRLDREWAPQVGPSATRTRKRKATKAA